MTYGLLVRAWPAYNMRQVLQLEHEEVWQAYAARPDQNEPELCCLQILQSCSAMTHCMATENLISVLPECFHCFRLRALQPAFEKGKLLPDRFTSTRVALCTRVCQAGLAHTKL